MAAVCSTDGTFGPGVGSCRGGFDFTLTFEDIFLGLLPQIGLLLLAPARLSTLQRRRNRVAKKSHLGFLKVITTSLYTISSILLLVFWSNDRMFRTRASTATAALEFMASLVIVGLSYMEHTRAIRPSYLLQFFLLLLLCCDSVRLRTVFLMQYPTELVSSLSVHTFLTAILLLLESLDKRELFPSSSDRNLSPEETIGLFGKRLFWHLNGLLRQGYRRVLQPRDLQTIDGNLCSERLQTQFKCKWSARGVRSLLTVVFLSIPWAIISPVVPRILVIGTTVSQPYLVSALLKFIESKGDLRNKNTGYGLIAAFCLNYSSKALFNAWYSQQNVRLATMLRTGLISLIYQKTLHIAPQDVNLGAATVLMNVDVEKVTEAVVVAHEFWAQTISVAIALYILYTQLGISFIAPLFAILMATALSTWMGTLMRTRQVTAVAATEKRVTTVAYTVGNTKGIRMLGLNSAVTNILTALREAEMEKQRHVRKLVAIIASISNVIFQLSSLAAYTTFAIIGLSRPGATFNFQTMFTSLSALKLVTTPLLAALQAIPRFQQGLASLDRIDEFLSSPDWMPSDTECTEQSDATDASDAIRLRTLSSRRPVSPLAISVDNASFGFQKDQLLLQNININIPRGSISLIVGKVASGKSVLLQALVGEIKLIGGGSMKVQSAGVAYAAQTPWLRGADIMENIVGESNYEPEWYSTVCWSVGLQIDFQELRSGDRTLVGSKGVSLSGGQKNRIALARAVYARKPVLIADDMLAGLDNTTEKLVFNRVFGKNGILKKAGTTVILATHSSHHASEVDHVIVMSSGRIAEQGTPAALANANGYLQEIAIERKSGDISKSQEDTEEMSQLESTARKPASQDPIDDNSADDARRSGDRQSLIYYLASVGWKHMSIFTALLILQVGSTTIQYLWLKWWAESDDITHSAAVKNLILFVVITVLNILLVFIWLGHFALSFMASSSLAIYGKQLHALMNATYSFIVQCDIGSITNRFSQDIALVDYPLPLAWINVTSLTAECIAQFAILVTATPPIAAALPFVATVCYIIQRVYLRTSRQIRLMDLEAKAPLCTHFLETVAGIGTVRAFGWSKAYEHKNNELLYQSQVPFYLLFAIQNWLKLVLQLMVAGLTTCIVGLAVGLSSKIDPGYLGLALVSIMDIGEYVTYVVLAWTNLETSLSAVYRIRQFVTGTPLETRGGPTVDPPPSWPLSGSITFRNLVASYKEDAEPVVRGVELTIRAGEKIGICGRTGSGKSSLVATLFGLLVKQQGQISIDGIDIDEVPLSTLRSKMVALPQDPLFLAGTVRQNLVPWSTSQDHLHVRDESMLAALEQVQLSRKLSNAAKAGQSVLDVNLDDVDTMLSHGEKQLFCLARAVLSPGRIVILDEATSGVDSLTDALMQKIVREAFKERTVIAIAHRLGTILDFDRTIVMDSGRIIEMGEPRRLLEQEGSLFRHLVEQQGGI